jgi:hypothetical protein
VDLKSRYKQNYPMPISRQEYERTKKLEEIFMPYAAARRASAIESGSRFAHYTSAANALKIIDSKRLWMRSTICMSDYSEVQHGFARLRKFFSDTTKAERLVATIDDCTGPKGGLDALVSFGKSWPTIQSQTYIASLSKHNDDEDLHGRLSMWRAFGNSSARVALVWKLPLESGIAAALKIWFSPVAYFDDAQVNEEMNRLIDSIGANRDYLKGNVDRATLIAMVVTLMSAATVSLKHEGFREEQEWRVIYSPQMKSDFIERSIETIDGIPQVIYKLPFDQAASQALAVLDLGRTLDRIIIGPTQYGPPMRDAFAAALTAAGIEDPLSRIYVSNIPIRT